MQPLTNSNSLPIALIQSLVVEVPGLKWGHDDTKDQMLGRALTYLVLYSTLGMMVRSYTRTKLIPAPMVMGCQAPLASRRRSRGSAVNPRSSSWNYQPQPLPKLPASLVARIARPTPWRHGDRSVLYHYRQNVTR
jgi:hypothetical protein